MAPQVKFVAKALAWARRHARPAEVHSEVEAAFKDCIDRLMSKMPWQTRRCVSWYHDRYRPDVGLWPTHSFRFRSGVLRLNTECQLPAGAG